MFLRNAWYVAGWEDAIDRTLKPIQVLGEKVVIFRRENGEPAALADSCPHRRLPLSMGRLHGDHVECGYHGMTFDCAGSCVRIPGQERIPPAANVRAYPVAEKWGLVWIWMGEAEKADPASIFQVEHYGEPGWGINRGAPMMMDCHYLYMTDNLLDPSHVAWVHQSSLGNAACEDEALNVHADERGVAVSRWMMNTEPPAFYKQLVEFDGPCDRKQHYEVRYPSNAIVKAIFTPAGTGGDDGPLHERTFLMDSYNFMTPVDENRTLYYWFQLRNIKPDDESVSELMAKGLRAAFEEDLTVLSAVHRGIAEETTSHIDIAIDAGPLRFRTRLQRLIDAETQQASLAAE